MDAKTENMTAPQWIRAAGLTAGMMPTSFRPMSYPEPGTSEPVADPTCWLCGGLTQGFGCLRAAVIRDTFTNYDQARDPQSHSLCAGCVYCLAHRGLRTRHILAGTWGLAQPDRAGLRQFLLAPWEPPCVVTITETRHKYLMFQAPVSTQADVVRVQFEMMTIDVRPTALAELLSPVEVLRTAFTRKQVLTGRYAQRGIQNGTPVSELDAAERAIAACRRTPLFQLAVFVSQAPAEMEEEEGASQ